VVVFGEIIKLIQRDIHCRAEPYLLKSYIEVGYPLKVKHSICNGIFSERNSCKAEKIIIIVEGSKEESTGLFFFLS